MHYGFIEKFIESLGEKYNIREIAFDRWGAIQMVQNLEGMGFTVVPMGQGFARMSPPSNLVIVCQLAGILEACNKSKYFLMPFILIIYTGEFRNCRTADSALSVWFNFLLRAILIPVKFERGTICCGHPVIIKIDNIAV